MLKKDRRYLQSAGCFYNSKSDWAEIKLTIVHSQKKLKRAYFGWKGLVTTVPVDHCSYVHVYSNSLRCERLWQRCTIWRWMVCAWRHWPWIFTCFANTGAECTKKLSSELLWKFLIHCLTLLQVYPEISAWHVSAVRYWSKRSESLRQFIIRDQIMWIVNHADDVNCVW